GTHAVQPARIFRRRRFGDEPQEQVRPDRVRRCQPGQIARLSLHLLRSGAERGEGVQRRSRWEIRWTVGDDRVDAIRRGTALLALGHELRGVAPVCAQRTWPAVLAVRLSLGRSTGYHPSLVAGTRRVRFHGESPATCPASSQYVAARIPRRRRSPPSPGPELP